MRGGKHVGGGSMWEGEDGNGNEWGSLISKRKG